MIFASKSAPLRMSGGPGLLRCPLRAWLLHKGVIVDGDSSASHTGSMVHKGLEAFHAKGFSIRAALAAAKKGLFAYRNADQEKANTIITRYSNDPRNKVKTLLLEEEITVTLDPWTTDKTGEPIVLIGHCDQVREEDGQLFGCDYKTTSKSGEEALAYYTLQPVLYAIGATARLNRPVHPGYICRVTGYTVKSRPEASPEGVFFKYPFDVGGCTDLINELRREVARVRNGEIGPRPNADCVYCPAGNVGRCSHLYQSTLEVKGRKKR